MEAPPPIRYILPGLFGTIFCGWVLRVMGFATFCDGYNPGVFHLMSLKNSECFRQFKEYFILMLGD